jgi:replicative DNA helicase
MLADTAAQTGTALILVSQLNKERDTGQIKPPPTGRDLRNTGAWYMRARVVLFVHRDQYMLEGTEIAMLKPDGHIRVEKATHGEPEIGFVNVTFNP